MTTMATSASAVGHRVAQEARDPDAVAGHGVRSATIAACLV